MNIYQAIEIADKFIKKSTFYSICKNVLIDGTKIRRTDMEVEIIIDTDQYISDKQILVDCDTFRKALNVVESPIFIIEGSSLVIEGNREKFTIPLMNPDDYPKLLSVGDDYQEVVIDFNEIYGVRFALDKGKRETLRGFCIDRNHIVATDGYRLVARKADFCIEGRVVIEPKFVIIMKHLEKKPVNVKIDDSVIIAEWENCTIGSRLIDVNYPNWRNAIPDTEDMNYFSVQVEDFVSSLRKVMVICSRRENVVGISIRNDKMIMIAETSNGSCHVECPIADPKIKTPKNILLNAFYLSDAITYFINGYISPTIDVFYSPDRPVIIRPKDKPDDVIHLIMPVRG